MFRTHIKTPAAQYAGRLPSFEFRLAYLVFRQNRHRARRLRQRRIHIRDRYSHHRPAEDHTSPIFCNPSAKFYKLTCAGTDRNIEITRLRYPLTGHRHHPVRQRLFADYRLSYRRRRRRVYNHHADHRRDPAGRHTLTEHRLYQLPLTALRILGLKRHDLDVPSVLSVPDRLLKYRDRFRLIVLNTNENLRTTRRLLRESYTCQYLIGPLQHYPVVARDIRLALARVNDQSFLGLIGIRLQLDRRRKSCPAHTNDSCLPDHLEYLFLAVTGNIQVSRELVTGRLPYRIIFTIRIYDDRETSAHHNVRAKLDRLDLTVHRRMYRRRNKRFALADLLTRQNLVTFDN